MVQLGPRLSREPVRCGRCGRARGLCHVHSAQVTGSVLDSLQSKRPSDASTMKCRSVGSSLRCEPRDSAECLRSLHFVIVSLLFDMMGSVSRNEAAGVRAIGEVDVQDWQTANLRTQGGKFLKVLEHLPCVTRRVCSMCTTGRAGREKWV